MHRSQITLADYNPRVMTPQASRLLKKSIKTYGLLEPFIWNKATGNLVGGHQRIKALDDLVGSEDYSVAVTIVELPLEKEKALNIALNNPSLQGQYDVQLLDEMIRNQEFDVEMAGFGQMDLEMLYINSGLDTAILDQMFNPAGAEKINEIAAKVDVMQDKIDGRAPPQGDALTSDDDPDNTAESPEEGGESDEAVAPPDPKALIKQRRKEFAERAAKENENDFFFTVVWTCDAEKQAFLKAVGLNPHEPHVDGWKLAELCGVDMDKLK